MIGEFLPDNLAEDLPTPVLIFGGSELDICWLNQSAQIWLGQSIRSIFGKYFGDIFHAAAEIKSAAARCLEQEASVSLRGIHIIRRGMAEERVHLTLFPTQGRIGMLVSRLAAQPSDRQSNELAMSSVGRMLAHEIKNPLAGIGGAAQLLRDDVDSEEGLALIKLIGSEIERIRRLTERMETLGDRDPENEGLVNIHEILRDARKLVQSSGSSLSGASSPESEIAFTEIYDPSIPETLGDRDTLMQAVLNLIKNASEAIETSGKPGEIKLRTSFRSGVSRKMESGKTGASLPIEIRITDDGPGISPAIRDQIFQPFVTNKPSGQGLGLALVTKVAAAHGGIVEVHSRPGKTVFSILLPVLKPSPSQSSIQPEGALK